MFCATKADDGSVRRLAQLCLVVAVFVTAFFGERWWARRAELREFAILRREFEEREAAQEKNKNRLSALRAAA